MLEYTATTTNATNTVTATALESNAEIAILVNGSPLANGAAATWTTGANAVYVTVTNGAGTKTYTVNVTAS